MQFEIKIMTKADMLYAYSQSKQLDQLTGCIGHLRGDFGITGGLFFTSWTDHVPDLKSYAFKKEFDNLIHALRFDKQYQGILKDRNSLRVYCGIYNGCQFEDQRSYGYRIDSNHFTYMLRLNPDRGVYNMYIYCYAREQLAQHMQAASEGIHFVDRNQQEMVGSTIAPAKMED